MLILAAVAKTAAQTLALLVRICVTANPCKANHAAAPVVTLR